MDTLAQTINTLPHVPGVYIYKDHEGTIIYVGKAIDLYKRVHQYFGNPERLNEKTRQLVALITTVEVLPVASEFDAILLEAKLIRNHLPKYNIVSRDDKSPIYIHISKKDPLPIVSLQRKPKETTEDTAWNFGPFSSGRIARTILKSIRHSIPFCMQKTTSKRPCFYTHLGLCNPCPSFIHHCPGADEKKRLTKIYRHNIKRLIAVLSGKSHEIILSMDKEIKVLSHQERFEEAGIVQQQQQHLKEIIQKKYEPFLYEGTDSLREAPKETIENLGDKLSLYFPGIHISRLECYDISNISGKQAVGSMVVLIDGIPDTSAYRRFKIQSKDTPDDPHMMAEMLTRRFTHPEWPFPELIVVDGGKTQIMAAEKILKTLQLSIPLCGLAKRREEIIIHQGNEWRIVRLQYHDSALQLLERIRDEAHRFAITYHRKLFRAQFLKTHTTKKA